MARMASPMKPHPDGNAVVAQGIEGTLGGMMADVARIAGGATPEGPGERTLEKLTFDGNSLDAETLVEAWKPPPPMEPRTITEADADNASKMFEQLLGSEAMYEPALLWDLFQDGRIAYSDSSAYAIEVVSTTGQITHMVRRAIEPEPVTAEIRSATAADQLRQMEEAPQGPAKEALAQLQQVMPNFMESVRRHIGSQAFYPSVPVVRKVRATWDGGLWVQRRGKDAWDDEGPDRRVQHGP